nr:transposase [Rhodoferax sp. MIZ03]
MPLSAPTTTGQCDLWQQPLQACPGIGPITSATGKTRHKTMTLEPEEFMRRFLLHVLPSGFQDGWVCCAWCIESLNRRGSGTLQMS